MSLPVLSGLLRRPSALWLITLFFSAGALLAVAVPGVFTIDENNYVATVVGLRHGDFALPGTAALPSSVELYWFDPLAGSGRAPIPVVSSAPPLYAFIALPFSYFGWRGLIAVNTFAFLFCAWLVFQFTARFSKQSLTPWLAGAIFAFGAYNLEYSLGVWPHMLSVAFCLSAFALLHWSPKSSPIAWASLAGISVGVAAGIRYQNIVFAFLLALTIFLWGERRIARITTYAFGVFLPVSLIAVVNRLRLGWWNPFAKSATYLNMAPGPGENRSLDVLRVFWARVVDFSVHPPIPGWRSNADGAFVAFGGVKKAWLQSCPWMVFAASVLVSAWLWKSWEPEIRPRLRAMGLMVAGMIGFFCLAGPGRHDGLSYNQRYFLELVPLMSISAAVVFEKFSFRWGAGAGGLLVGAALALIARLGEQDSPFRTLVLMKLPLGIALASLALNWRLGRGSRGPATISALFACGLGWSITVQLIDDLPASRKYRTYTRDQYEIFASVIPDQSALVTRGITRDAAGPLLLKRDVVVLDAFRDEGESLPKLVQELHARGRRIFLDAAGFPEALLHRIAENRRLNIRAPGKDPILELEFP